MAYHCLTLIVVLVLTDGGQMASINKRPLTAIKPISCSSKSGEVGVCMYAWHCLLFKGTHLTTCFDGIFVGSCCRLPSPSTTEPSNEVLPEDPTKGSNATTPVPATLDWRPVTSTSVVTSIPDPPPSESSYNLDTEVPTSTIMDWTTTEDTTVEPVDTPEPFTDSPEVNSEVSVTDEPSVSTQEPVIGMQEPSDNTRDESTTLRTSVSSTVEPTTVPRTTETVTTSSNNYIYNSTVGSTTRRPTTPTWVPVPASSTVEPIPAPVTVTQKPAVETEYTTVLPNRTSDAMQNYKEVCGRPRLGPQGRIVGGMNARYAEWPWMISLRQWKKSTFLHKCGAALLNGLWAVTAAHCVESVPPSDLLLRMGEYDVSNDKEPESFEERRVQIVASHPKFDPRTFEYDLALLRFYQPVKFRRNILPICIPQSGDDFVGKTATVTGWGRLYEDGPLPSVMQEVQVPVITNAECESMYKKAGFVEDIPDIFICAGRAEGGKDSCEGDSGGPMVLKDSEGRWTLAGIISWGIGCALPNQPGVYTRITKFANWIEPIIAF